jgi:hypothetical protein
MVRLSDRIHQKLPIDTTHEIQLDGHEGRGTRVLQQLNPQL